jgi:hypothetical protein
MLGLLSEAQCDCVILQLPWFVRRRWFVQLPFAHANAFPGATQAFAETRLGKLQEFVHRFSFTRIIAFLTAERGSAVAPLARLRLTYHLFA